MRVKATITAIHTDGGYPDWVSIRLVDAHGVEWWFTEKVPVVTVEDLDETSECPRPVELACEELGRRFSAGRELVRIDLARPWGIYATDDDSTSCFEVIADQIVP